MPRFSVSSAIAIGVLALTTVACQSFNPFTSSTADASMELTQNTRPRPGQMLDTLELTTEQRTQIETIRKNTRAELETVLTTEQRDKLQTLTKNTGKFRSAMAELNLSATQEQSLRQLMQQERQQIMNILTPEQQEKLRQLLPMRRS